MVSGIEPLRFRRRVLDAYMLPPVVQLMIMLRPIVEALRAADSENSGVLIPVLLVPAQQFLS